MLSVLVGRYMLMSNERNFNKQEVLDLAERIFIRHLHKKHLDYSPESEGGRHYHKSIEQSLERQIKNAFRVAMHFREIEEEIFGEEK